MQMPHGMRFYALRNSKCLEIADIIVINFEADRWALFAIFLLELHSLFSFQSYQSQLYLECANSVPRLH